MLMYHEEDSIGITDVVVALGARGYLHWFATGLVFTGGQRH